MDLLARRFVRKFSTTNSLIRNIGIIAHIDAGKTTTTERLIYKTGLTKRVGSVDDGDTVMDYLPEERERGITITSAAITLPWRGHGLNLIDTPGHVDFTVEVERSLRVMDGTVVILDASKGIQAQTLTVWRQARRHGLKSFIYVNKMDKLGADLEKCLRDIKKSFGLDPILLNEPIFENEKFTGVKNLDSDVIKEKLPQYDDEFLEKFVEGEVDGNDVRRALQRVTEKGNEAIAVLVGSSAKDIGIEQVLDGIVDLLPSPKLDANENDFKALAFKVIFDLKRNCFLVYCRVYSGKFVTKRQGGGLFNLNRRKREVVGRIMQVMADEMIEIDSANAGQIVILTGLKYTATGDTLTTCHPHNDTSLLEGIKIPSPVISVSLVAESSGSQDHLDKCLEIIQLEDPSARVQVDNRTGQTILSGMGELHLEILESKLRKEMKAQFTSGPVTIAFQEAFVERFGEFRKAFEVDREIFGIKLKGSVNVTISELNSDECFIVIFEGNSSVRESVIDAVSSAFNRGPKGGYRLHRNCKITIENLQFSTMNSAHVVVFEALQSLLQEIAKSDKIVLQEPLVQVEIECPEEFKGEIMTDLFSMRNCVDFGDEGRRLLARAPLRKMLGYSSWLRSRTGGLASFTMETCGYTNFIE